MNSFPRLRAGETAAGNGVADRRHRAQQQMIWCFQTSWPTNRSCKAASFCKGSGRRNRAAGNFFFRKQFGNHAQRRRCAETTEVTLKIIHQQAQHFAALRRIERIGPVVDAGMQPFTLNGIESLRRSKDFFPNKNTLLQIEETLRGPNNGRWGKNPIDARAAACSESGNRLEVPTVHPWKAMPAA